MRISGSMIPTATRSNPSPTATSSCGKWLAEKLRNYGADVIEQDFTSRSYDGKTLNGVNIIAQINPGHQRRVILAAHWDSRHIADYDPDQSKRDAADPDQFAAVAEMPFYGLYPSVGDQPSQIAGGVLTPGKYYQVAARHRRPLCNDLNIKDQQIPCEPNQSVSIVHQDRLYPIPSGFRLASATDFISRNS